jgi:excisionase family DNA binding protein
MSDRLLPLREVARRLGVAHRTVQRHVASGRLPTVRTISGYHRVRESALAALLPGGHAEPPAPYSSPAVSVTRTAAQIPVIPTHAPPADRSMAGQRGTFPGSVGDGQIVRRVQTDRKW